MDDKILDIAQRIRGMREDLDISAAEMAELLEITESEYLEYEDGKRDFPFTFLYKTASRFGLDISDLITVPVPGLRFIPMSKGPGFPSRGARALNTTAWPISSRTAMPSLFW